MTATKNLARIWCNNLEIFRRPATTRLLRTTHTEVFQLGSPRKLWSSNIGARPVCRDGSRMSWAANVSHLANPCQHEHFARTVNTADRTEINLCVWHQTNSDTRCQKLVYGSSGSGFVPISNDSRINGLRTRKSFLYCQTCINQRIRFNDKYLAGQICAVDDRLRTFNT